MDFLHSAGDAGTDIDTLNRFKPAGKLAPGYGVM
jgi:hypothetical protein